MVQNLMENNLLVSEDGLEKVGLSSIVSLNTQFTSQKLRIDITGKIKSEAKKEQEQSIKNIQIDRVKLIDAAIVRIMKQRKVMRHTDLMGEILGQLSSRFQPTVPMIKKRIDWLIEHEYIERVSGENSNYQYLA
jgi:cullin 1